MSVSRPTTWLTLAAMALSCVVSPTSSSALSLGAPISPQAPGSSDEDASSREKKTEKNTAEEPASDEANEEATDHETVRLRGKVVFLADALERRFGVTTVPESRERSVALVTDGGQIVPIVDDVRGRAFRVDARLRDVPTELLGRRHRGSPMLQVIRLFQLTGDERFQVDYWCDVCAIAMFELKPCDCCQGDIELRRRQVGVEQVEP